MEAWEACVWHICQWHRFHAAGEAAEEAGYLKLSWLLSQAFLSGVRAVWLAHSDPAASPARQLLTAGPQQCVFRLMKSPNPDRICSDDLQTLGGWATQMAAGALRQMAAHSKWRRDQTRTLFSTIFVLAHALPGRRDSNEDFDALYKLARLII